MIPLTEKNIVSNREYIHKEHYKILFLARLEADKGVKELLLAVAELKNNYSFSLDLVGSGGYLQQAKDLVKELDISEYVKIHGTVLNPNKVRQFYLDSDLYILPTYHEGFPRTLYEAMIFGAPIMTTFVGGIPSIMSNKYNCLEIKPKSVESIVNCITYAFDNYSSVAELTTNAIKTVLPIIQSSRQSHAEHLNTLMREF
jgi:glycosyltransferase involved in cell wall biosynthesis